MPLAYTGSSRRTRRYWEFATDSQHTHTIHNTATYCYISSRPSRTPWFTYALLLYLWQARSASSRRTRSSTSSRPSRTPCACPSATYTRSTQSTVGRALARNRYQYLCFCTCKAGKLSSKTTSTRALHSPQLREHSSATGFATQFTGFTSTNVQILTRVERTRLRNSGTTCLETGCMPRRREGPCRFYYSVCLLY